MKKLVKFNPTRDFDDRLGKLVDLYQSERWQIPGVDVANLAKDADAQVEQRASSEEARRVADAERVAFLVGQEERWQRFSTALAAARAVFGRDKVIAAKLDALVGKRKPARTAAKATTPPAPPQHAGPDARS